MADAVEVQALLVEPGADGRRRHPSGGVAPGPLRRVGDQRQVEDQVRRGDGVPGAHAARAGQHHVHLVAEPGNDLHVAPQLVAELDRGGVGRVRHPGVAARVLGPELDRDHHRLLLLHEGLRPGRGVRQHDAALRHVVREPRDVGRGGQRARVHRQDVGLDVAGGRGDGDLPRERAPVGVHEHELQHRVGLRLVPVVLRDLRQDAEAGHAGPGDGDGAVGGDRGDVRDEVEDRLQHRHLTEAGGAEEVPEDRQGVRARLGRHAAAPRVPRGGHEVRQDRDGQDEVVPHADRRDPADGLAQALHVLALDLVRDGLRERPVNEGAGGGVGVREHRHRAGRAHHLPQAVCHVGVELQEVLRGGPGGQVDQVVRLAAVAPGDGVLLREVSVAQVAVHVLPRELEAERGHALHALDPEREDGGVRVPHAVPLRGPAREPADRGLGRDPDAGGAARALRRDGGRGAAELELVEEAALQHVGEEADRGLLQRPQGHGVRQVPARGADDGPPEGAGVQILVGGAGQHHRRARVDVALQRRHRDLQRRVGPEVLDVVRVDVDVGLGVVADVELVDLPPEGPVLLQQPPHQEPALELVPKDVGGVDVPRRAGAVDAHGQDAEVVAGVPRGGELAGHVVPGAAEDGAARVGVDRHGHERPVADLNLGVEAAVGAAAVAHGEQVAEGVQVVDGVGELTADGGIPAANGAHARSRGHAAVAALPEVGDLDPGGQGEVGEVEVDVGGVEEGRAAQREAVGAAAAGAVGRRGAGAVRGRHLRPGEARRARQDLIVVGRLRVAGRGVRGLELPPVARLGALVLLEIPELAAAREAAGGLLEVGRPQRAEGQAQGQVVPRGLRGEVGHVVLGGDEADGGGRHAAGAEDEAPQQHEGVRRRRVEALPEERDVQPSTRAPEHGVDLTDVRLHSGIGEVVLDLERLVPAVADPQLVHVDVGGGGVAVQPREHEPRIDGVPNQARVRGLGLALAIDAEQLLAVEEGGAVEADANVVPVVRRKGDAAVGLHGRGHVDAVGNRELHTRLVVDQYNGDQVAEEAGRGGVW